MTEAIRAAGLPARRLTPLGVYYAIFTVSGCAGLIYESIWTHYLKLLLGHAAYAQTVVLSIFMGGLALGSWWAGSRSLRWSRLLLAYALVEAVVGLFALGFHPVFVAASAAFQNFAGSSTLGPVGIEAVKWSLAALLIAPQSCLLGMTFPLLSAGLLRTYPNSPGKSLATLYCCNSLGATVGVLASGLWLIAAFGLPGTIALAGVLNLLLAASVWVLNRDRVMVAPVAMPSAVRDGSAALPRLLLAVAAFTGLSSFMYELSWIRMLSMVLGAATHSFELMLSAFILGLALGGLWIRRQIDKIGNVLGWLAALQLAMAACALASLALYAHAFEAMAWLLGALSRSSAAYGLFLTGSHALALFIMLPATLCAGTTLPLITHAMLRAGQGERAIGTVYAANTLGAIVGVLLTVHVVLPTFGLRNTMVVGAAIDLVLGVTLLAAGGARTTQLTRRAALASVVLLVACVSLVHLDPRRMAAGVYRYGRSQLPHDNEVVFHGDGKTASIDMVASPGGKLAILTNGKPDAAINPLTAAAPSTDESTMVMLGALPLALHPGARTVANIGMGSGLTTSTLLASATLERVDTIEIEAKMVEAARGFLPRVERTYHDPRSHIVIDDAKTYFSARREKYDIIVSEPSNPWVSGVASLFSIEFYDLIARYLNDDGVLVQWLQLYEFDDHLLASVINAITARFPNYVVYQTDDSDLVVVASRSATLDALAPTIFDAPAMKNELARVGIHHIDDLRAHRIGSRATLEPLFASFNAPTNSDYRPYVDQHAPKARFMGNTAQAVVRLAAGPLPLLEMLDPARGVPAAALSAQPEVTQVSRWRAAQDAYALLLGTQTAPPADFALHDEVVLLNATQGQCEGELITRSWAAAVFRVALELLPQLRAEQSAQLWLRLGHSACARQASALTQRWLALYAAVGQRNAAAMLSDAQALLDDKASAADPERFGYLLACAMLGALAHGEPQAALDVWSRYGAKRWNPNTVNVHLRLLLSSALFRVGQAAAHGQ